jgi:hypothetical protein
LYVETGNIVDFIEELYTAWSSLYKDILN